MSLRTNQKAVFWKKSGRLSTVKLRNQDEFVRGNVAAILEIEEVTRWRWCLFSDTTLYEC